MKRCFKNIICIFIIIIMSVAMVFTINYAKNHNNNQIGSDMKTPPDMPEKTNDDKPSNDNQSSDTQRPQPPTENNGDMKNNMEEPQLCQMETQIIWKVMLTIIKWVGNLKK